MDYNIVNQQNSLRHAFLSVYQSISLSVYQKLALKVIISMQMSIGAKKL